MALAAGGLLVGVALAEVAARFIRPPVHAEWLFDSRCAGRAGLLSYDPELAVVPTPGFDDVVAGPGFRARVRINALGLRGEAPDLEGPSRRWIVLGDSFTLARQVSHAETFTARLSAETGLQFYNAGVDAYSTWQAVGRWRRLHPVLKPEGVLLVFFLGNDFTDNARFRRLIRPIHREPPVERGSGLCRLLRHSHLHGHWVVWREQQRSHGLDRGQFRREMSLYTVDGASDLSRLMVHTHSALAALRKETARQGQRLLVALAPSSLMIDPDRGAPILKLAGLSGVRLDLDAPLRAAQKALSTLGVSTCDLTPALRAAHKQGVRSYLDFDGHWTPAGHRVVAKTLAGCLERHGSGAVVSSPQPVIEK